MKKLLGITPFLALTPVFPAPALAQEGYVFTEEEVAPPEEMVFTEEEVAPPEIEGEAPPEGVAPPAESCDSPDIIANALGVYSDVTVGPAHITYSGGPDGAGSYDDPSRFGGSGRISYDFTTDSYTLTATTEPIADIVVTLGQFGQGGDDDSGWADFGKGLKAPISTETLALAVGCDTLPDLRGYGTGTGGMVRHQGFPVDIRMQLDYLPGEGGKFAGVMELRGHTKDGYDVVYNVWIFLQR